MLFVDTFGCIMIDWERCPTLVCPIETYRWRMKADEGGWRGMKRMKRNTRRLRRLRHG
jgi:hypothetical protein